MALRFSKLPLPRICNSCSKVAKYQITAGIHDLILCYDCSHELMDLVRIGTGGDYRVVQIDEMHMQEVSHDPHIS